MAQTAILEPIPNALKKYTGAAGRLLKLLCSGCTPAEASRAVGVDDSYTSQLMAEGSFRDQVNEGIAKTFAEQSVIDENYIQVEKILSKRLVQQAEHIYDPDKILRALKFANEAKKKVLPQGGGQSQSSGSGTNSNTPVTLILPMIVAKEFILNPNNEVVGVNGKELLTLPSAKIGELVESVRIDTSSKRVLNDKSKHGSRPEDPWGNL